MKAVRLVTLGEEEGSPLQGLQFRRQIASGVHAIRDAVFQQRTKAGVLWEPGALKPRPPTQAPPHPNPRLRPSSAPARRQANSSL